MTAPVMVEGDSRIASRLTARRRERYETALSLAEAQIAADVASRQPEQWHRLAGIGHTARAQRILDDRDEEATQAALAGNPRRAHYLAHHAPLIGRGLFGGI